MKNFIAPVIVIVGVGVGGFGGNLLKAKPAAAEHAAKGEGAHKPAEGGHEKDEAKAHGAADAQDHKKEKKADKKKEKKSADAHGGGDEHSAASGDANIYFKFTREFIVPLMKEGQVDALIIININLEADPSLSQTLFSLEPKLRDNIMTTLIGLSNDGVTFETMTDVDSYETLRSTILMNLQTVVATGVENVLILDMAKQDV